MVRWALSHQDDEDGFDAAKVLTAWAKKRRRGVWSARPLAISPTVHDPMNGKLAEALASFWAHNPHELASLLDRVETSLNDGRA